MITCVQRPRHFILQTLKTKKRLICSILKTLKSEKREAFQFSNSQDQEEKRWRHSVFSYSEMRPRRTTRTWTGPIWYDWYIVWYLPCPVNNVTSSQGNTGFSLRLKCCSWSYQYWRMPNTHTIHETFRLFSLGYLARANKFINIVACNNFKNLCNEGRGELYANLHELRKSLRQKRNKINDQTIKESYFSVEITSGSSHKTVSWGPI